MSKKLTKFCRITSFIEQTDKAFADAIDKICMFGPFAPNNRETGVTFLYPHKALKDEIIKKAYSDNAEDANAMLRSLIISGYFPSASDFTAKGYVVNRLSQIVNVSSASGDVVKFADGVGDPEAKLNKSFKGMGVGKDNKLRLAVYDLTKGSFGIKGDHISTLRDSDRFSRSSPSESHDSDESKEVVGKFEGFHGLYGGEDEVKQVSGGYDYTEGNFDRVNFWKGAGEAYIHKFFRLPNGDLKDKFPNPLLEKLVSLLCFMEKWHPNEFKNVIDIVDYGPHISLYLLIEPYKLNNYVVKSETLNKWKAAGYPVISDPLKALKDILSKVKEGNGLILREANKVRARLFDPKTCTMWYLSSEILKAYKELNSSNLINPLLKSLYAADSLLKIQQDEARFLIQNLFIDLEERRFTEIKQGILTRGEVRGVFKKIKASHPLTKSESQLYIGHSRLYETTNVKGVWFDGPFAFLRSIDFLYIAVNDKTVNNLPKVNFTADIPNYKGLINQYEVRMKHTENYHEDRALSIQGHLSQINSLIKHSKINKEQLQDMQKEITNRLAEMAK